MCILALSLCEHPLLPVALVFNRDERKERPTDRAAFYADSGLLFGRDQLSGGSWLGLNTRTGVVVALTNHDSSVEDVVSVPSDRVPISRGRLVRAVLDRPPTQLREGLRDWHRYAGFQLLAMSVFDEQPTALAFTNRPHTDTLVQQPSVSSGSTVLMQHPERGDEYEHGAESAVHSHAKTAVLGKPRCTPFVEYHAPTTISFSNGSLFEEDTGGPKVAALRRHMADLMARLPRDREAMVLRVDHSVPVDTIQVVGVAPEHERYEQLRDLGRSVLVSRFIEEACVILCRSDLFEADGIRPLSYFLPNVYASAEELFACQQIFVKGEEWVTRSQTMVLRIENQAVVFLERNTYPNFTEWLRFVVPIDAAASAGAASTPSS